uniref:Uncharacterized protein n=1 Tax=Angiostrongylus cantonensis TaxID=6313 RepID=A0A0K0DMS0_ANGCA
MCLGHASAHPPTCVLNGFVTVSGIALIFCTIISRYLFCFFVNIFEWITVYDMFKPVYLRKIPGVNLGVC